MLQEEDQMEDAPQRIPLDSSEMENGAQGILKSKGVENKCQREIDWFRAGGHCFDWKMKKRHMSYVLIAANVNFTV